MKTINIINLEGGPESIKNVQLDDYSMLAEDASDGSHTFDELYSHRYELFITLCRLLSGSDDYNKCAFVWKTKLHSDGTAYEGYFLLGINLEPGKQISYHLPIERWNDIPGVVEELERAPQFDGHSAQDVISRLKTI